MNDNWAPRAQMLDRLNELGMKGEFTKEFKLIYELEMKERALGLRAGAKKEQRGFSAEETREGLAVLLGKRE